MKDVGRSTLLMPSLILAIGIAACGYFVGNTMYNAKVAINTAEVKGLAERRVEADRAYWQIHYTVSGSQKAEIARLYEESEAAQRQIVALLIDSGFEEPEISPGVIDYIQQEFRDEDQNLVAEKYLLIGSISIETDKVNLVSEARSKLNELIAFGIDIKNNEPAYYFTRLNDIKPEMLQEATKNARLAANEFAVNAGVSVGGIRDARQGGFIIRDVGENFGDTKKIEKNVRVVTTITFYLTP